MKVPTIKECQEHIKNIKWYIKKEYPDLYNYLLDIYRDSKKFSEKLYRYLYKLDEIPKCICGNPVHFLSFNQGYSKYCSQKCSAKDKSVILKREQTNLQRYGVTYKAKLESCKEKTKETCKKKYGVEYTFASKEILEKCKKTCKQHYGVEHPMQSKEIQEKTKETCKKKYGVEYIFANKEIQEKSKETCKKKYGVDNIYKTKEICKKRTAALIAKYGSVSPFSSIEIQEKCKETCMQRYGVERPIQFKEIQEKLQKTCMQRYGVKNVMQSEPIKNKIKEICKELYSTEYTAQSESIKNKIKDIFLERYGVENPFKALEVQNKIKEVFLERYGVDNPFKALEVQQKIYNTKKLNHTFNSSSAEEHFKTYLDSKNISYKTQYKSEKYPFCCDFYLDDLDLYIEIQGNWTHGNEPYNESNKNHQEILESWKSKSETHKYYKNAINVWTIRDVLKRETAKQNQLRYLEIFSCKIDEVIKVFEDYIKSCKLLF